MSRADRYAAKATVRDLAARCYEVLGVWSGLQRNIGSASVRKMNRLFDESRVYLARLSSTSEGRSFIESWLTDSDPGVRLTAATYVLTWNEPPATAVLKKLDTEESFPFNASASIALEEFDKGRLQL